ncbi:hypothetical protein SMICM17S_11887 [Streptomyces microflavus]
MDIAIGEDDGTAKGRWRLLLLEDCDELIRGEAKHTAGQAPVPAAAPDGPAARPRPTGTVLVGGHRPNRWTCRRDCTVLRLDEDEFEASGLAGRDPGRPGGGPRPGRAGGAGPAEGLAGLLT